MRFDLTDLINLQLGIYAAGALWNFAERSMPANSQPGDYLAPIVVSVFLGAMTYHVPKLLFGDTSKHYNI